MQIRCRLAVFAVVAAALFAAGPASAMSFGGGSKYNLTLKSFASSLTTIFQHDYSYSTWSFDTKTYETKSYDFNKWDGYTSNDCRPKPPPPPPGVPEPSAALLFAVGTVVATRRRFRR